MKGFPKALNVPAFHPPARSPLKDSVQVAVPMREPWRKSLEQAQQRESRHPDLTGFEASVGSGGMPENRISFPPDKHSLPTPKYSGTSILTGRGFAPSSRLQVPRQTRPP